MSEKDHKIKVGIIRGGTGKHYESSLRKGGEIISHIFDNLSDKYKVVDILIDKKGDWHLNGVPINPADLTHKVDVVWNTSKYSDLAITLGNLSIPHIGNDSFFEVLENNNEMLRRHMKSIGVDMPRSIVLPVYQKDFDGPIDQYAIKKAKEVFEKFSAPWIVKSFTEDLSMGIHLAKTFSELAYAIEDGVAHQKSILVEEFIVGKVASLHSVPGFREQSPTHNNGGIYVFPMGNSFGSFSGDEKDKLFSLTKDLHKHIGAKHYLKSDFVLNPRGKVYLLGVSGTPDLKADSHFSQVCDSVGAKMHHIIEHILEQALNNRY